MRDSLTTELRHFCWKETKPSSIESKNPNVVERMDSSCNKRWKGYPYVEEYMEIILFLNVKSCSDL